MKRLSSALVAVAVLGACGTSGSKGPRYEQKALEKAALTAQDVGPTFGRDRSAEKSKSANKDAYKANKECRPLIDDLSLFGGDQPDEKSKARVKRVYEDDQGRQIEQQMFAGALTVPQVRDLLDKCSKFTYERAGVRVVVRLDTEDKPGYGDESFALRIEVKLTAPRNYALHAYDIVFGRGNAITQVSGFSNIDSQLHEHKLPDSLIERLAKEADRKLKEAA